MKKQSLILESYLLAAVLIFATWLCISAYMGDRVDYKYCSDGGEGTYYTVKGTDTTRYVTAYQRSNFGWKWVDHSPTSH